MNNEHATEIGYVILRYFIGKRRMAEVRIPRDIDERERDRLLSHLRIDLFDEWTAEKEVQEP